MLFQSYYKEDANLLFFVKLVYKKVNEFSIGKNMSYKKLNEF